MLSSELKDNPLTGGTVKNGDLGVIYGDPKVFFHST